MKSGVGRDGGGGDHVFVVRREFFAEQFAEDGPAFVHIPVGKDVVAHGRRVPAIAKVRRHHGGEGGFVLVGDGDAETTEEGEEGRVFGYFLALLLFFFRDVFFLLLLFFSSAASEDERKGEAGEGSAGHAGWDTRAETPARDESEDAPPLSAFPPADA